MTLAPETVAAVLIALGALIAAARLAWLRRGRQGAALALLTLASAALLWLTLFPPRLPVGGETLLVATAETPASTRAGASERLVALPEAPPLPPEAEAERVPDLATALRRYPQVQRLRILGRGLPERDRDGAAGLPARFTPLPLPRGLVRLDPPPDTAAGTAFALAGEASGLAGGSAELLDPAGRRVDFRALSEGARFTLGGTARAPGLALFTLRLRGADGRVVSDTPVPLRTRAEAPIKALLIAAPSPEAKYLRRWAEDAGIALASRLAAGGGIDLGDDTGSLDAARLRGLDVLIIDDRALEGLGSGTRAALASAVAGGLGVVVRMTGPATSAARSTWRALGLDVAEGGDIAAVALPPLAPDADALAARRGPGSADAPAMLNTLDDPAPELGRWTVRGGAGLVPAVSDAEGALIAGWQQRGRGRVAIWTLADSFALVLNGQQDRYDQWWSAALSAVVRAEGGFRPELPPLAVAGTRIAVCGIGEGAKVAAPDGAEVPLALDPAAGARGCAAFWPLADGVHTLIQPGGPDGPVRYPFAVLPADALKGITARETGEATVRWAAAQGAARTGTMPDRRGAAWPWLLGWLMVSAALWLLERRWRAGPGAQPPAAEA